MSKFEAYLTNYDSQIGKKRNQQFQSLTSTPIFILCDSCYWCTTYFDKTRIPVDNICPKCGDNSELSSFPIATNESFTFSYNDKRGIEFEFKPRRKDDL